MTKQETAEVMAILAAAYPRFYANQTDEDKMAAVNLWYRHFADVSYNVMLQAVHLQLFSLYLFYLFSSIDAVGVICTTQR